MNRDLQIYLLMARKMTNFIASGSISDESEYIPLVIATEIYRRILSKSDLSFMKDEEKLEFEKNSKEVEVLYTLFKDKYINVINREDYLNKARDVVNTHLQIKDLDTEKEKLEQSINARKEEIKSGAIKMMPLEEDFNKMNSVVLGASSLKKEESPKQPTKISNIKGSFKKHWKKITTAAVAGCSLLFGLAACNLNKQPVKNETAEKTVDVVNNEEEKEVSVMQNVEQQIDVLANFINSTRAYGNEYMGDVAYDAYLVSNSSEVFKSKDFMAQLNYYNADGTTMLRNTLDFYRKLTVVNSYWANNAIDMVDFSNIFINEQDKTLVSKMQTMSYDIIKLSHNSDATSKQKVEDLKQEFNDLLVNSDFDTTTQYSDQARLFALLYADTTQAQLQATFGDKIFSDEIYQQYLNAIKECEAKINENVIEDIAGQAYFSGLSSIENMADDLRTYANGKIENNMTRDEIVEAINAKVNVKYISENELHGIDNYSEEYIGEAQVVTNSNGQQKVTVGGHSSGGTVVYPEGQKETGTTTQVVVDETRGPEVIEEEIVGGDHDKNNDGKEDTTGAEITINPGGNYNPDIPMWDGNISNVPEPDQVISETFEPVNNGVVGEEQVDSPAVQESYTEPVVAPTEVSTPTVQESQVVSETEVSSPAVQESYTEPVVAPTEVSTPTVQESQVVSEVEVSSPAVQESAPAPVEEQASSAPTAAITDSQKQQMDFYAQMGVSSQINPDGSITPVIIAETADYGKTL